MHMSDSGMTNGEISRRLTDLGVQMSHGFDGVNTRIDRLSAHVTETNGRVVTVERNAAVEMQKVVNIERELFAGHTRAEEVSQALMSEVVSSEHTAITRRDLTIATGAIVVAFAIIRWLPALLAIGKNAP
jgi:hypothetical protein